MRPKRDSVSFMLATMAPSVDLFLWPLIFQFLEAEDLACLQCVFHGGSLCFVDVFLHQYRERWQGAAK